MTKKIVIKNIHREVVKARPVSGTMVVFQMKQKTLQTIANDSDENADWMHQLPGYKTERAIHEALAKKYTAEESEEEE